MDLAGRVALVTGGARRLGRHFTLGLARAGADVVIDYHRSGAAAAETAAEVERLGRRAVVVEADVAVKADVERLVRTAAEEFGRLDVLVNSASTFESAPLLSIAEADWDRVLAVNLKGPFLLAQAAAPLLQRDGGGVIVNLIDLSAFQPWPEYAHHSVSKAGLAHLTRVLARGLGPAIRVNAIAPGAVLPPEDFTPDELRRIRERSALKRLGEPDHAVRTLLFLVENDFITGETIAVDGGRLLL